MKKILTFGLILLGFSLQSCKDFLEVAPQDQVSDEATIFDKTSAETAVRGAYRGLANLNYSGGFQNTILQSGGDVFSVNVGLTDLSVTNYDLRSDIPFLQTYWNNNYNTINRTNHIIEKVPLVTDIKLTMDLKNQFLGEAYFIRALSYFDLAKLYGGVQIFLTPTKSYTEKIGVKKSTQAQVFAQILDDLNKAEGLLPATVVRNRATKFTVYALRARLYLYLNRFDDAEKDLNLILANTSYRLIKPFALATGTTESVLELTYSINNQNPGFTLWQGNRQLSPTATLHNLLNDSKVGGGRKILSKLNTSNQYIGSIFPTNASANYVIRTAELYLNRAEARLKKSNPDITGALSDLNVVKARSEIATSTANTKESLLLEIENERRVEFALEPHRWFDLVRTGRAAEVLKVNNANKYIFPIPANEILVNPVLEQNVGY
jgi:tetratricopeptide (TPR) repeat protein